jgi:hypothetical protein
MKNILLIVGFFCCNLIHAQNYFVQHDLCEFRIKLPYFIQLTPDVHGSKLYRCSYGTALSDGYGELRISCYANEDDYFKGDKEGMMQALREYSEVSFDDDRSVVDENSFTMFGRDGYDHHPVYFIFVYGKTHMASIRYDYTIQKKDRIEPFIRMLAPGFTVN